MHLGRQQDQPGGASRLGQVLGQEQEGPEETVHLPQPEQQKPRPWLLAADWLCAAAPGSASSGDLQTRMHTYSATYRPKPRHSEHTELLNAG